jgi:putative DNA primase/helicase
VQARAAVNADDDRGPIVAEPVEGLSPALARLRDEAAAVGTRSERHYALVARAVDDNHTDGQILTLVRDHAPSFEKYGYRLEAETRRTIGKVRAPHAPDEDASSAIAVARDGYRVTDDGNSQRLIALAEGKLRYVVEWDTWLVHQPDGRWHRDNADALVTEHAKRVAQSLFALLPETPDTPTYDGKTTLRKATFKCAIRAESSGAISGMIRLARGNPAVIIEHEQLDADPNLLNCPNGTVDLRTGKIRPHDPADLMTLQTAVPYGPDAQCPTWEACLERWQPNEEIRRYLQLEARAGATGYPTETLSIYYGDGGNGKSKYGGAIQYVLGDYTFVPHKSLLVAGKHEQHETTGADLFRKRLGIASETKAGDALDEEQVKAITGGDRMRARRMREDSWFFDPTHTLIVYTNHRPKIGGTDEAIWRRARLVPWDVTIPVAERDLDLAEKLKAEGPGILRWIVEGAQRFLAEGFDPPDAVRAATDSYRADEDVVGRFVAEMLTFAANARATSHDLSQVLQRWCSSEGLPELGIVALTPVLKAHGCTSRRQNFNGQRFTTWTGVEIIEAEEAEPDLLGGDDF